MACCEVKYSVDRFWPPPITLPTAEIKRQLPAGIVSLQLVITASSMTCLKPRVSEGRNRVSPADHARVRRAFCAHG